MGNYQKEPFYSPLLERGSHPISPQDYLANNPIIRVEEVAITTTSGDPADVALEIKSKVNLGNYAEGTIVHLHFMMDLPSEPHGLWKITRYINQIFPKENFVGGYFIMASTYENAMVEKPEEPEELEKPVKHFISIAFAAGSRPIRPPSKLHFDLPPSIILMG